MNAKSSNRTAAKASATGAAQGSTSTGSTGGRKPGAREDSTNTTDQVAQADAAPEVPMALIVIAPNPKRKGTKAATFFEKYPTRGVLSDFMTARRNADGSERVRGKDISWDADRRHILLGDEATNFPANGSREDQAAYLLSLPKTDAGFSIDEKRLIAWGYMDAPVEEAVAATAAVAKEEATAS